MILTKQCACGQTVEYEAEDLPQLNCPHCGRSLHDQFAPDPNAAPRRPRARSYDSPKTALTAPPNQNQIALAAVRAASCYKTLRGLIGTVIGVGLIICVAVPAVIALVALLAIVSSGARSADLFVYLATACVSILATILLTALKQSMLLAIDAVDILIADRADHQVSERARREQSADQFENSAPTGK